MAPTYSIAEGQAQFHEIVRQAQSGIVATIADGAEPVAYILGKGRMDAIIQAMEILANPAAMQALAAHKAVKPSRPQSSTSL